MDVLAKSPILGRWYVGLCLLTVCLPSIASSAEVTLNGHTFQIPDGYTLDLVAGPPLVDRPVSADFDEQGRLYVTEASGTNANVRDQLQNRPHRVLRLVDSDGDGHFDRRTIFADRMMLPEGALWNDGSLYVAAPPSIWKLTDSSGDGIADERSEWFEGKTLTGCANDLHGPYLGRDGWIYWCKGAFAEQTYERPGQRPFVTRAAHIFRRHPSGTGIVESVMTGGMDNPVEVVFNLGGERFFTTTFLQHPSGGRRDGILHAVYGGVYGKVHNVIDDHIRTGDLMPTMTHLGAAAPSGLALLESSELEFPGQLVATLFNMRKVTRHELHASGATYTTTDHDLVVSDNLDFHPTDVLEDADGSLLIVDTGGWYKLCCPTSQLEKADVLGGIYRLRRLDRHQVRHPRGLRITWSELNSEALIGYLGDDRPAVQKRAAHALVKLDHLAVLPLARTIANSSGATAAEAVWVLARIDDDSASAALGDALVHSSPVVRQAALHAVSVRKSREHVRSVLTILADDPSLQVRRAAAEAITRIGGRGASQTVLDLASQTEDPVLLHSLVYALCELGDRQTLRDGLTAGDVRTRVLAAVAAEQNRAGSLLSKEDIIDLLSIDDETLQRRILWIVDRHPDWNAALVTACTSNVRTKPSRLASLLRHRPKSGFAQELASEILTKAEPGTSLRLKALETLGEVRTPLSDQLVDNLVKILNEPWSNPFAIAGIREVSLVLEVFRNREVSAEIAAATAKSLAHFAEPKPGRHGNWQTYASVPPNVIGIDDDVFQVLVNELKATESFERGTAIEALLRVNLSPNQQLSLARLADQLGPLELPQMLTVLAKQPSDSIGRQLVQAMRRSRSIGGIAESELEQRIAGFSAAIQREILALSRQQRVGLQDHVERIARVLPLVEQGDVRRGQKLFHSAKAACITCHELGYLGGEVGPDLSRIGNTRSARDLLESVLVPNASFVRSYEPWLVETTDGRIVAGILREDSPQKVVLITAEQKEVHLERDSIDAMKASNISIMPSGFGDQISDQDLADLVKFLLTAR